MDTDTKRGMQLPAAETSTGGTEQHHLRRKTIHLLILALLAIAGALLATQHWTHVSPFIPYLFILACPLMHLFGHGHHGHHGKHPSQE